MGIALGVHASIGGTGAIVTPSRASAATGSSFLLFAQYDGTFTSLADNKSNTIGAGQLIVAETTSPLFAGLKIRVYLVTNGSGGAGHTFTLTTSASAASELTMLEITGGATSSIQDVVQSWVQDSATPFTTNSTGTLAQAAELAVVYYQSNAGSGTETFTLGNSFVAAESFTNAATDYTAVCGTQVVSSTASIQGTLTLATGTSTYGIILTFKELVAATSQPPDEYDHWSDGDAGYYDDVTVLETTSQAAPVDFIPLPALGQQETIEFDDLYEDPIVEIIETSQILTTGPPPVDPLLQETEWVFDDLGEDYQVEDYANFDADQPPQEPPLEDDDLGDEFWASLVYAPVGPDAAAATPTLVDDPWSWDDAGDDEIHSIVGDDDDAVGPNEPPVAEDGWPWDEAGDDEVLPVDDAVVPNGPEVAREDPFDWEEGAYDETTDIAVAFSDDALFDVVAAANTIAPQEEWIADDEVDELFIDDFANFDADAIRDDAWPWDETVEDEWQALVDDDDDAVGPDAPGALAGLTPEDPWSWDEFTDDPFTLDDPIGADAGAPLPVLGPVDDWQWLEEHGEDWAPEDSVLGADVVQDQPAADEWVSAFDEEGADAWESGDGPVDTPPNVEPLPDDAWAWFDDTSDEPNPDDTITGANFVALPANLAGDDAWPWHEEDGGEEDTSVFFRVLYEAFIYGNTEVWFVDARSRVWLVERRARVWLVEDH